MANKGQEIINKIIQIDMSRVGTVENPPNSNNIDCNTWYYGHPVSGSSYPYCCVEQEYDFFLAGVSNLIKRTASCGTLKKWYESQGRIFYTPKVGDHVFLTFSKDKKIQHIGYVVKVYADGSVDSYEGNTSKGSSGSQADGGGCYVRHRTKGNIVCFGRPNYDGAPVPTPTPTPTPVPTSKPIITTVKLSSSYSTLNVRNKPSTDGEILRQLKNGSIVPIFGTTKDGEWYRLNPVEEEWVAGRYITSNAQGVVTASTLSIRSADSTAGAKWGEYKKGDVISLINQSTNTGWYLTPLGWVCNDYVTRTK